MTSHNDSIELYIYSICILGRVYERVQGFGGRGGGISAAPLRDC